VSLTAVRKPILAHARRVAAAIAVAALLGSAAHPAGPGAPAGEANPPAAARQTRPQQIEELIAYLGYGGETKHIDVAIPYLAANVAPSDPTWNKTHPRWRAVSALVGRNLHDDAQEAFAEPEAAIVRNAVRAMSDGVVREDLEGALAFFRSRTGRHFLELQNSLIDLSIEVSLEKDTEAGVTVENLDARKRVLDLWLPIVFIRAIYGPQSADRTIDAAYQKYSRLRGPQLDALAQRFAEDLPEFEKFAQSASFGRIIEAERRAEEQTPAPNLPAFFAAEAKRHASDWHAAYLGS